jgi:hypothetical protein
MAAVTAETDVASVLAVSDAAVRRKDFSAAISTLTDAISKMPFEAKLHVSVR